MWKKLISTLFCFCLLTAAAEAGSRYPVDLPYESYTYSSTGTALLLPAPYTNSGIMTGADFGIGTFQQLSDIYNDGNNRIYLSDTGNNRIVVMDDDLKLIKVLDSFINNGKNDTFNHPTGVYSTSSSIYVADSENARILMFDKISFAFQKELPKPEIAVLGSNYTYKPLKIAVDAANRVYVIAEGVNQGLIELNENGKFTSFLGAPAVSVDMFDLIWRKFATKEQIAQLQKYVPTEYDALSIDDNGFIYAVSKNSEISPVAKLNSKGDNVINMHQELGDSEFYEENPYFIDLAVDRKGVYFFLDSKQGKIYVYSREGDLLFAFGFNASQRGCFYSASSIELIGDKLFVSDSNNNTITVFERTKFGKDVLNAVQMQEQGKYVEAYRCWQSVSLQCSHYPPAEIGIAQMQIKTGKYAEAMKKMKAIRNEFTYADAFEKWRDEIIRKDFLFILLGAVAAVFAAVFLPKAMKKVRLIKRCRESSLYRKYQYSTHTAFHPFDGFWDIKREKKGDLKSALLILGIFTLFYAIRSQFSGYSITGIVSSEVNVFYDCLMILLPLGFYIIANWCFTTLMDGEGSIKDILIASCYALKPYIIFSVPLFFLSHVLTQSEAMFYTTADTVCWIWILALLFIGMMVTHDYSLSKAFLALVLTLIGICLIIFIGLLLINVVQDVVVFVTDIYSEVSFRFY